MKNGIKRIDESLSIRNGHLFIEECDTVSLAERFGTPLYVISEDQLRRNIRRYQKAFQDRWSEGDVRILPAIKANWTLVTRRILTEEGAGCDCYSESELYAALESGIDPKLVSVNGGGKSEAHIRNCIEKGVRITVDDIDELSIIERVVGELNKKATIRFRLRPNFSNLWRPSEFVYEMVPIDLGVTVYKNGIPTEAVVELGRRALKNENIEVSGFHIHLGRHHGSIGFWRGQMKRYARLIAELKEALTEENPQLKEELNRIEDSLDGVTPESDKKELAKPMNKMRRFLEKARDENSDIHKAIKGAKKGVELAQKVGKTYNKFAQWLALPVVPDLFLRK